MKKSQLKVVLPTKVTEPSRFDLMSLMDGLNDSYLVRLEADIPGIAQKGDMLLSDRGRKPRRGDVAIFLDGDGDLVIERYKGRHLREAGEAADDQEKIWGVALTLIRQLN